MVSLKAKILLLFGGLITLLMMVISLSVLYQWRKLILTDQMQSAESIARSFSFSIIDALIYQQNDLSDSDEYLQSYLLSFKSKTPNIRFVAFSDVQGRLVAHSELSALRSAGENFNKYSKEPQTLIFQDPQYGWITETHFPLRAAGKNWGMLHLAIDAAPTRQAIRRLFFLLFSLTALSVLIILAVMYIFSNRLTSSLSKLVKEMDKVDLERETITQLPAGNDEIGFLVRHFEEMKKRLLTSREQLIKAQKQIYQAEKLASIGRLASGVAHEINNPLHGIKNCLYTIRREPDNIEQSKSYLNLMDEGLNHIESVVQKLLSFSRQSATHPQSISINKEMDTVLSLLEYRLDQRRITIIRKYEDDLPRVMADAHLMQEVFMNLLLNSFDAVPEDGQITIETGLRKNDLFCKISDNGAGIPKKHMNNIFEPFFTTKEEGKGTGLGLAVSLGIIEAHGGRIEVESKKGLTSFVIILPLHTITKGKYENSINRR